MYYEFDSGGGNRNILSAFSNDGLVWNEDSGIRIAGANMPAAVVTGTGVKLYFNAAGTIRSATSSDGFTGLAFVEDAGDRVAPAGSGDESGGIGHPCVIRLAAGFGHENYARLSKVKAQYDPENVFRLNHNIKPA
jgi:FAD/FMN-containing dehydrogenase